jgi:hypothetical protein
MNQRERHLNESIVFAAAITVFVLASYFISQMVGFDKMNLGASPKKFSEVVAEWPRFLILGMATFSGSWLWLIAQKEPSYVICNNCKEISEKGKGSSSCCIKCGGKLEDLEGYYDRHPEQRTK